jgi:hypothetical protein
VRDRCGKVVEVGGGTLRGRGVAAEGEQDEEDWPGGERRGD